MSSDNKLFTTDCKRCSRLADFLLHVKVSNPEYLCKPVPSFGPEKSRLLIVGLAPGLHGANATGRPFTGDFAGILLYQTLHKFGFASRSQSVSSDDGLELFDCRITNAVRCLPPQNKPLTSEVSTCSRYLQDEIAQLPDRAVLLALGTIAHRAVLKAMSLKMNQYAFAHNAVHKLEYGVLLVDSYHCSRYNTQTRRLTPAMFEEVFLNIRSMLL